MDYALKYFLIFFYPVALQRNPLRLTYVPSSQSVTKRSFKFFYLLGCCVTLVWSIYHQAHFLTYYFFTHVVARQTGFSIHICGRLLGYTLQTVYPLILKLYIIFTAIYKTDHFLDHLNQQQKLFKETKLTLNNNLNTKSLKHIVCSIICITLLLSNYVAYCLHEHLVVCNGDASQCHFAWITPVLDYIYDWFNEASQMIGVSLIPLLVGVLFLQFTHNLQSVTVAIKSSQASSGTSHVDEALIDLVIKTCELHSKLVDKISGGMFVVVSLLTLHMIVIIPMVARSDFTDVHYINYQYAWIVAEFTFIAFLCYASSHAVQAVSHFDTKLSTACSILS